MMSAARIRNYTDAIENLPEEAFLGSLIWFSISGADVDLDQARADLAAADLRTDNLRKNLRPIDAFRKAANEFKKLFPEAANGVKSEIMVRSLGEDDQQSYRHLVRERFQIEKGKRRSLAYDKVAELTFTRGLKKAGEYTGHGVEGKRRTGHLSVPLTPDEDRWLTDHLADFEGRYQHLLHFMDSHAVRTFVRDYIYALDGTCVKGSGGLYFVAQRHVDELGRLGSWVRNVGSEFRIVPLLNLVEQRGMILEAFEDEVVEEIERLMAELAKILEDADRQIEEKTFDGYALRAAELSQKIGEYDNLLGARAHRASTAVSVFTQQVMSLAPRIRQSQTTKAKVITTEGASASA